MICRVGILLRRQIKGLIDRPIHHHLVDVDLLLPDTLFAHPAPLCEGRKARRDAGGIGASAGGDLVLTNPAPAILVAEATQGRQDADVQRLKAFIIEGGCGDGSKAAHRASPQNR